MPITLFPTRADTIAERMSGFIAHLRHNGVNVGVSETESALKAMGTIDLSSMKELKLALKTVCAKHADQFENFDELFKAYWHNRGRDRQRNQDKSSSKKTENRWSSLSAYDQGNSSGDIGNLDLPDDDGDGEASQSGEGKLVASQIKNIEKADLREFMKPEDLEKACQVAEQLAKAVRDRRSRRRKQAKRGALLDLRKIARKSVSKGGEPIELIKRKRPDRPIRLVALLDVSGSMTVYSRVFLAFLKGLMSADQTTDAYLFHTQLVRISDALRDGDTFRAVNRLSMMAQGFGGGTKIASNIALFNRQYAAQSVNGKTVVVILSDGYDSDAPELMADELSRLKKRGCRIIWLNPLKGWKDYEPVARGMAAALPHLDLFSAATTLQDLAALEPELSRI